MSNLVIAFVAILFLSIVATLALLARLYPDLNKFHMSQNQDNKPKPNYWLVFICLIVLILFISVSYGYVVYEMKERGTFGDMFGGLNAIFSGLALTGVVLTLIMQMKDLELTREEVRKSTDAQDKSQKALNEQLKSMQLSSKIEILSSYLSTLDIHANTAEIRATKRIIADTTQQYFSNPEYVSIVSPRFEAGSFDLFEESKEGLSFRFLITCVNMSCSLRISGRTNEIDSILCGYIRSEYKPDIYIREKDEIIFECINVSEPITLQLKLLGNLAPYEIVQELKISVKDKKPVIFLTDAIAQIEATEP